VSGTISPTFVGSSDADFARDSEEFLGWMHTAVHDENARLVTYFARVDASERFVLTVVVQKWGALAAKRVLLGAGQRMPSQAVENPAFAVFEREMAESVGVPFDNHPWLKPVRFDTGRLGGIEQYPFFEVDGKEVHEVAVGPIHAGIIEPGHFRFMCHGEDVKHLEIHLGYQHRGVLTLCRRDNIFAQAPLIETVAGDTSIGHTWAYAQVLEACADVRLPLGVSWSRAVALELERIGMHLVGLAGLCTDIGFLPGGSTFGRLRTTIINSTMLVCGSRFGRGWVRPGGTRATLGPETRKTLLANLERFARDFETITAHFLKSGTVRHRLEGTGTLTAEIAAEIGLVGLASRSAGGNIDQRNCAEPAIYGSCWKLCTMAEGDCLARARIRIEEIRVSVAWLRQALDVAPPMLSERVTLSRLRAKRLVVSLVEGFRGECVHCLETDDAGAVVDYRIQDPSLRNWFGLAQAVRNNPVYDFPLCNKSFDLSYCGNDL
jgi:Ni,Fe-hydrogenase III large subunit